MLTIQVARTRTAGRRGRSAGYILIMLALSIVVLLGIVGLGVDIGRMYVAHAETQTFCDSGAMYAAVPLNGQASGINAAVLRVNQLKTEKLWNFQTQQVTNVKLMFASRPNAAESEWKTAADAAASPALMYFARVTATAPVGLTLLSVVVGPNTSNVTASAVAGRSTLPNGVREGPLPFSPFAQTTCKCPPPPGSGLTEADRDPATGMLPGVEYTLRWTSGHYNDVLDTSDPYDTSTNKDIKWFCEGDQCACMATMLNTAGSSIRGFIEFSGSADIRASILGEEPFPRTLDVGDALNMTPGERATENAALSTLASSDTDPVSYPYGPPIPRDSSNPRLGRSYTYANQGNGMRIVTVPVNSGPPNYTIVGFRGFFLRGETAKGSKDAYPMGNVSHTPLCAEYIGSATLGGSPNSGGTGPIGPTIYKLRLYK